MPELENQLLGILRVALFGAGKMSLHHIKAIQPQGNAKLVAIADPALDARKIRDLSRDIELFHDPQDLLKTLRPDVIHICTPPMTHASLAIIALNHGAHIYVEKPFAQSVLEAKNILSLAKNLGLKVCAGHQLLFEQPAVRALEYAKKLGRIVHVESYFSFRPVRQATDGRSTISPIDQLFDILPHPVYLLLQFLRPSFYEEEELPVDVRVLDIRTRGSIHGIIRRGDVTGTLVVTLEGRPIESYIKVVGTNGSLIADFVRGVVVSIPGPGTSGISKIINPYRHSWQTVSETTKALIRRALNKQKSYPGLVEIINAFYKNIQSGNKSVLSESSILETVAICEEANIKLRMMENQENIQAESELNILESRIPSHDTTRGVVLVTGGTGFLGRAVSQALRSQNLKPRVVARKVPPASMRIPGVEYMAVDLGEDIPQEIFKDVSTVVHCAAETVGGKEAHAKNSIDATRNILNSMATAGVKKYIHISSIAVLQPSHAVGGSINENTPLVTDSEDRGPYVWGKAESERLAMDISRSLGIDIRIIRPGPLVDYSAFEPPGRLGREVGPFFVSIGSRKGRLSLCNIRTAAEVIRVYVENFDTMPAMLNLVEPDAPTRADLTARLLTSRPDLKVLWLHSFILRVVSPVLKLFQRILLPGKKPVDIYAAFASVKYNTDLAAQVIQFACMKNKNDSHHMNEKEDMPIRGYQ